MRILKPLPGILPMPGRPLADAAALWPMNSLGNKVYDLSGNGNVGTEQVDSVWQPGKFGTCRYFSGDDYISVSDHPSLNPSSQLSIVVWVNQTSIGTTEVWVGKESAANNRSYYLRSYWTGAGGSINNIEFILSSDGTAFNTWRSGDNIMTAGVWNQVVAVYNSGETEPRLYFNGQHIAGSWAAGAMPASLFDNTAALEIGTRRTGTEFFTGLLSNVLIYNRALSSSEIALLYREPFCMFPENIMPEFAISA